MFRLMIVGCPHLRRCLLSSRLRKALISPNPAQSKPSPRPPPIPTLFPPGSRIFPSRTRFPSPEKFLGRIMGAPGELLGTEKTYAYARALAAASPRVRVFTIGHSEEGREILLLAIADEAGIRDLDRLKAATTALADPRRTDQAAAEKLISNFPPHLLLQCRVTFR